LAGALRETNRKAHSHEASLRNAPQRAIFYEPVMDAPILPVLEERFSLAADLRKIANIAIRIHGIRIWAWRRLVKSATPPKTKGNKRIAMPDANIVFALASIWLDFERARVRKEGYKFEIPNPTLARPTRRTGTVAAKQ